MLSDRALALRSHKGSVLCLQKHPWKHLMASGSEDGNVRIWNLHTNKTERCIVLKSAVISVCFSPKFDDERVWASTENIIRCFDLKRDEVIMRHSDTTYNFNTDEINQIAVSGDANFICACDDSGEVKIIDTRSHQCIRTLRSRQSTNIISTIQFRGNHANLELLSGGMDYLFTLWDVTNGKRLFEMSAAELLGLSGIESATNPPFVHVVALSEDGNRAGIALGNGDIILIDVKKRRFLQFLRGHTAAVAALRFFQSGRDTFMMSASNDRTLIQWRIGAGLAVSSSSTSSCSGFITECSFSEPDSAATTVVAQTEILQFTAQEQRCFDVIFINKRWRLLNKPNHIECARVLLQPAPEPGLPIMPVVFERDTLLDLGQLTAPQHAISWHENDNGDVSDKVLVPAVEQWRVFVADCSNAISIFNI